MQFLHAGPFISNVVGFYAGGAPPREHLHGPLSACPQYEHASCAWTAHSAIVSKLAIARIRDQRGS